MCYIDDPLEKLWAVVLKSPERKYYEDNDDKNEVEIELEDDHFEPKLLDVDLLDEDMASYMRNVYELIQLS